jgi:hypothetical protein
MAAIVQGQNACLWHRMSWVRSPLAAPILNFPLLEQAPVKALTVTAKPASHVPLYLPGPQIFSGDCCDG